ncbi:MAG TPA: histidine phosphatase family protein [Acidimicrobiales bacterium]|nr:histidine phosphatase family protein [Acidimicrobiales bacterium]
MTRVWLVRHGEPSVAIGRDPGLTELGHRQAEALVDALGPAPVVTSPLRRARETALPLEHAWGAVASVEPLVRELPSPTDEPAARREWLLRALRRTFADLGDEQRAWRDGVISCVRAFREDTVVTTHAVVINAVVGAAVGDDRVLHCRPAHASVTVLDIADSGALTLVELGHEKTESFLA